MKKRNVILQSYSARCGEAEQADSERREATLIPHHLLNQHLRIQLQRLGHSKKLDHVELPFTALVFADEGLVGPHPLGEFVLRQTGLFARSLQQGAKALLALGVNGFLHAQPKRDGQARYAVLAN